MSRKPEGIGGICYYRWRAPFALPNGQVGSATRTCVLKKGHQGPHQALDKCIEPKKKEK